MRFKRDKFYSAYRNAWGSLDQTQVDGINFLLDRFETETRITSLRQLAYVLSSVKHETADTYQPVKEYGMRKDKNGRWYNVVNGRPIYRRYEHWFGRGLIQITWDYNYEKFGSLLGIDLKDNPDLALEPKTAYEILIIGMSRGLFTGKKLSDFINGKADYRNARKIVNGLDKADHIAGLARQFEKILEDSVVQVPTDRPVTQDTAKTSSADEGADKTPAPLPQDEKAGEAAPDTPAKPGQPIVAPLAQVNVEHADRVINTAPAEPSKPDETVTVQKVAQSLGSKIMAGGTLVTTTLTAVLGALLGVIKNPVAFAILIVGGGAISAWLWNRSKDRQTQTQLALISAGASKDKNTVSMAPSPAKGG